MLIFSVGGDSIADHENLQQVKVLRALAPKVPLVIISDSDDVDDVAAAFAAQAQGSSIAKFPAHLHTKPSHSL